MHRELRRQADADEAIAASEMQQRHCRVAIKSFFVAGIYGNAPACENIRTELRWRRSRITLRPRSIRKTMRLTTGAPRKKELRNSARHFRRAQKGATQRGSSAVGRMQKRQCDVASPSDGMAFSASPRAALHSHCLFAFDRRRYFHAAWHFCARRKCRALLRNSFLRGARVVKRIVLRMDRGRRVIRDRRQRNSVRDVLAGRGHSRIWRDEE